MQSGVAENEARVKSSPHSSPSPTLLSYSTPASAYATSAVNSLIQSVSGSEDDDFEEKPKINGVGERVIDEQMDRGNTSRSTIPVPSLISVTAATAEAPSMNFAQGYRVGGAGEMITEQVLRVNQGVMAPAVAAVPVLQSQQGFVRLGNSFSQGGSELAPIFPGVNNSWGPHPVRSSYQFHCFPYSSMCVSSAAAPNLKRKVEVSGNSFNSPQMEGFFAHMPSGFYQDSVFVPVQAVFQNHFLPTAVGGPPLNYPMSASPSPEAIKNQEVNILPTSQDPGISNPLDGCTSFPIYKRKVVRPSCSSSLRMTVVSDGNKNTNLKPPDKQQLPPLREHNSLETTSNVRALLASTGSEPQPGYLSSACVYKPEDDKEIEGKGWMVLVQKELRNTDVGNLGRIVLPKKDAEANLPPLVAKDGVILQMEDMTSSTKWKFKYRYWPNNRSRMYVMENTGDFVRMHNLQTGDFFIIYREESSGKYIARGKKGMVSLYAGNPVEPIDHGRTEEGNARAISHLGPEQGIFSVPSGDYEVVPKAGKDAFVTGESFDFERETGEPTQFTPPLPEFDFERETGEPTQFTPPLPDLHPDDIP